MIDETLQRAIHLLQTFNQPWAVCGGWAIDLFLDQKTRQHKDLDITIKRHDQLHLGGFLLANGWTLRKVVGSELLDWKPDDYLDLPVHNVWCSHPDFPPHYLEILFSEANETHYMFRRHQAVRLPLTSAFITSSSGIPILAPEIVLLFKAKYSDVNPDYQQDFEMTVSRLNSEQQTWLKQALCVAYGKHVWIKLLP